MRVKAITDHVCYCCGGAIKKGEECIAFIVSPENPDKAEFDIIYICLRCSVDKSCQVKVRKRSAEQ
ncbi:hypothetical protein H5T51_00975 [Candidatus Bathyarchaeota archaeon]|nr:hypothetical protein [Candidatus Bathyarchaeota archaeon]